MDLFVALESIVSLGARESHAARTREMRDAFAERTGAFAHTDPWFESRSRAFWDDAVTTQHFAHEQEGELAEEARAWVPWLERAHRGLFVVRGADRELALVDLWSGAEFLVTDFADGARKALEEEEAPFDARIVGSPKGTRLALLPGALFHAADARTSIDKVLADARAHSMKTQETLDALLRMEHSMRSLSRVKVSYAYRPEALRTLKTPKKPL